MTTTSTQPTPPTSEPNDPGPLITAHAALVFLMAAFIGAMAGVLTALSTGNTAASVLAGLSACGVSIPVLHKLIH
ncbi:hypothetical protein [Streptomyces venezuelae]|uniref:hypothetical protein n=1 Tax=Streptomyces venezuelae TaxID=54571 RepID=UPI00332FCC1C